MLLVALYPPFQVWQLWPPDQRDLPYRPSEQLPQRYWQLCACPGRNLQQGRCYNNNQSVSIRSFLHPAPRWVGPLFLSQSTCTRRIRHQEAGSVLIIPAPKITCILSAPEMPTCWCRHSHTYSATFPPGAMVSLFSASFSAGPLAMQSSCSTTPHHYCRYCYNKKRCRNLVTHPANSFASCP